MDAVIAELADLPSLVASRQISLNEIAALCDAACVHVDDMRETFRYLKVFAITVNINGAGLAEFADADNAAQTEKIARQSSKDAEASGQAVAADIGTLSGLTVQVATEAGDMLNRLVPDIRKTAELVAEVSAACREQDIGASQINEAIQQRDRVIPQNAGVSEQRSATSEELAAQAEELQASIGFFRIGSQIAEPLPVKALPSRRPAAPVRSSGGPSATTTRKMAPSRQTVAAQQARAKGFALDLSMGGPDDEDADFRESA